MKSLLVKLGAILIGLAIFSYAEVWGADWKLYGGTDKYLAFYDAQSISRPSKNIVTVWEKFSYTEKGVLNLVGKIGKKFENLSFSIHLSEINCAEKRHHLLTSTDYDNKGSVIHSDHSPSDWQFIVPESIGELLYKEVCK